MARPKSLETIIKEAGSLDKRGVNKLKKIYDKLGANFAAAAAEEMSEKSKATAVGGIVNLPVQKRAE